MTSDLDWSNTSIYDEVHGYIPLTKIELNIVNHPLFQRLNHIKQLGNTYRVFPGAHHTRFSHSLGVMSLIDRMICCRGIRETDPDETYKSPDERQKLRLAALLHDIGHYPFSHAIESIFSKNGRLDEGKHERFGEYLLKNTSLKDYLNNFNPDEISYIFRGHSGDILYNQLMTSELDADRADYLLRDSKHTGVVYGRYDIDRIIHTLRVSKNGFLGVHEEGVRAAENYVIGRYLMWTTVYTHKTIGGYDELLKCAFERLADDKYSSLEHLKKLNENELIKFTDNYVLNKINEGLESKDPYLSEVCKRYLWRGSDYHLHIADEEKGFFESGRMTHKYFKLDEYRKKDALERLITDDDMKGWIFHNNSQSKLPSIRPPVIEAYIRRKYISGEEVSKPTVLKPEEEREMERAIFIIDDTYQERLLVEYEHSLVRHLQNLSYDVVRIYTKKDLVSKVKAAIERDLKRT